MTVRKIFIVAGEPSGDVIGGRLMAALKAAAPVEIAGVGGPAMIAEGLASLFPVEDITLIGIGQVITALPRVFDRIARVTEAILTMKPDAVVLIDSPDFTHRVARRVRKADPGIPIVNYVSPTVWAWRPGRARAMAAYIDHLLAILPFEPEVHRKLGGPPTTYVGHPLVERLDLLRPDAAEASAREAHPPTVLVLPGSRRMEIDRLTAVFGAAIAAATAKTGPVDLVLPAVPHLRPMIEARIAAWPVKPRIVTGEGEKYAAFRRARAALAASGTVSLELALAGVPMVIGYRVPPLEWMLRFLVKVPSIVLANLAIGRNVIPEFMQEACTSGNLAAALVPLIAGGPERDRQVAAFAELDAIMVPEGTSPSALAARIVLDLAARGRRQK